MATRTIETRALTDGSHGGIRRIGDTGQTRRSRGAPTILLAIALAALALLRPLTAHADQVHLSFTSGVSSAGAVSGGLVFGPTFTYGFELPGRFDFSITGTAEVTGATYGNPGVIIETIPALGLTLPSWRLSIGPAVDVLDTILCDSARFCNRVAGVAPGMSVGVAYFTDAISGRLGAKLDAHVIVVPPGAVFSGPLVQISIGPVLRLGNWKD